MNSGERSPSSRILTLRHVGVDLGGHTVIDGINLDIRGGIGVGLTGPSGSGKTVLCLLLAAALAPTRGEMLLDGARFGPRNGNRTGLILQSHGLVAGLTAEENVALPMQTSDISRHEVAERTHRALSAVGLADLADRRVEVLSGGEHQRVGIARALAGDAPILVADEPTAELDPVNRAIVLELLMAHCAKGNLVVVASDDPEVIGTFPQVVELDQGQIEGRRSDS